MSQAYTGFKDKLGVRIYHNSLVRNDVGNIYIIKKDPYLDYTLVEVLDKTVEKLQEDICHDLTLVLEDATRLLDHRPL